MWHETPPIINGLNSTRIVDCRSHGTILVRNAGTAGVNTGLEGLCGLIPFAKDRNQRMETDLATLRSSAACFVDVSSVALCVHLFIAFMWLTPSIWQSCLPSGILPRMKVKTRMVEAMIYSSVCCCLTSDLFPEFLRQLYRNFLNRSLSKNRQDKSPPKKWDPNWGAKWWYINSKWHETEWMKLQLYSQKNATLWDDLDIEILPCFAFNEGFGFRESMFSPASRVLHTLSNMLWRDVRFSSTKTYIVCSLYHCGQSFVSSPFLHAVCLVWLYRFLHHVQNCLRVVAFTNPSPSSQYVDFIKRLGEALSLQIGGLKECSQVRYVWGTSIYNSYAKKKQRYFEAHRAVKNKKCTQLKPSLWVLP